MVMPPLLRQPIKIYAGDYAAWTVEVQCHGLPVDLSQWTEWSAQWRTTSDSDTAISLPVVSTRKDEGVITVQVPADVSRLLTNGQWDLQSSAGGGANVQTWVRGPLTVINDITR